MAKKEGDGHDERCTGGKGERDKAKMEEGRNCADRYTRINIQKRNWLQAYSVISGRETHRGTVRAVRGGELCISVLRPP